MYKPRIRSIYLFALIPLAIGIYAFTLLQPEDNFVSCTIDPAKTSVKLYWKDEKGQRLKSLSGLKNYVESKGQKLLFAMNGGMYQQDGSPLGLYIQENKILHAINKRAGTGNFYMQPNGIFYITKDNQANICHSGDFVDKGNIQYATQSGPMLLISGSINPAFNRNSRNLNIRNGVGILPGNKLLFAMSKVPVNFYDFASYFKRAGCNNALYLDGFVSRTYLPEKKWLQMDGDFGVMIGAIAPK